MDERRYELKDVYDYLLDYYNIEWLGYKIIDKGVERRLESQDFKTSNGKKGSSLSVIAVVYNGSKLQNVKLDVTNYSLSIEVEQKPKIGWQKFLNSRYNQEQVL